MSLFELSRLGHSVSPGLRVFFLSHLREVFSYYVFKYALWPFLCLFSFWNRKIQILVHFMLS